MHNSILVVASLTSLPTEHISYLLPLEFSVSYGLINFPQECCFINLAKYSEKENILLGPPNMNYDKVPRLLTRKLLSAENCVCGHGGFRYSWTWRKQNIKLSPDLWRQQGPPRSQQIVTDLRVAWLQAPTLKAERKKKAQRQEFCYHSTTELSSLYWNMSFSKGMAVGLCHLFHLSEGGEGGRKELLLMAWPPVPGTILIVL